MSRVGVITLLHTAAVQLAFAEELPWGFEIPWLSPASHSSSPVAEDATPDFQATGLTASELGEALAWCDYHTFRDEKSAGSSSLLRGSLQAVDQPETPAEPLMLAAVAPAEAPAELPATATVKVATPTEAVKTAAPATAPATAPGKKVGTKFFHKKPAKTSKLAYKFNANATKKAHAAIQASGQYARLGERVTGSLPLPSWGPVKKKIYNFTDWGSVQAVYAKEEEEKVKEEKKESKKVKKVSKKDADKAIAEMMESMIAKKPEPGTMTRDGKLRAQPLDPEKAKESCAKLKAALEASDKDGGAVPAADSAAQWNKVLGGAGQENAKKMRCGECTRPLSAEDIAAKRLMCSRCINKAPGAAIEYPNSSAWRSEVQTALLLGGLAAASLMLALIGLKKVRSFQTLAAGVREPLMHAQEVHRDLVF